MLSDPRQNNRTLIPFRKALEFIPRNAISNLRPGPGKLGVPEKGSRRRIATRPENQERFPPGDLRRLDPAAAGRLPHEQVRGDRHAGGGGHHPRGQRLGPRLRRPVDPHQEAGAHNRLLHGVRGVHSARVGAGVPEDEEAEGGGQARPPSASGIHLVQTLFDTERGDGGSRGSSPVYHEYEHHLTQPVVSLLHISVLNCN